MIDRLRVYNGTGYDPHNNLAIEQVLLEGVQPGEIILYLWQNQNTVVIGRNQNAWKECRTTMLAEEGGRLARRLSGGGAVFHDLGNLNFTFLVRSEDYDLDRQLSVIMKAVQSFGIEAERSGRNDVLAAGRKFSGNAFYSSRGQSYHHGTLLVDVDMEKLGRYLNPSKAKLASKGVDSTRSRVVNLKELAPRMDIEGLRRAMEAAFAEVYAGQPERIAPEELDAGKIRTYCEKNRSFDWLYGRKMSFTFACEERFPWGGLELELSVDEGRVQDCVVYTDAMDHSLAEALKQVLTGSVFSAEALCSAVKGCGLEATVCEDICRMLKEQDI